MTKRRMAILVLSGLLMLNTCSKEPEVSPERFQVLTDTLGVDLDYAVWMDFAYEMCKNYPQEQSAAMVMLQASERALMEQDEERFEQFFSILKDYPQNGSLELSDQIAFGNRLAWNMAEQMLLFNKAGEVMDFTIQKFEDNQTGLQWRDELGAMIYDTQGNVYERMDETDKALAAYGKALSFFEQPETFLRRGLILETQGKLDSALDDFTAALSLAPGQVMISSKVKDIFSQLNPDQNADQFLADLLESFMEERRETVLSEVISMAAPAFEFTDMQGRVLNNQNQLGKVVFVDFWATWCNPCRRELPEFQKFYDLHRNDPKVAFIAASTDSEREKVAPYIQQSGYTFPVGYAGQSATKFGVEGIPSLFIIGPQGKIRYKIVGFDPDKDFVREMTWRLESLLDI